MNELNSEAANGLFSGVGMLALSAFEIALIVGIAVLLHRLLMRRLKEEPGSNFRGQLLALALAVVALIMAVVVLPIGGTLRGQLLGFIGILLSAVIALSSTTFVGNVMAGAMLRVVKSCRPGRYIKVGDHFGRVSEMDLFHLEIQTEESDLVTLPNLYMVTNPMRVLRRSGTIVSVDVSLGYDVPRRKVEKLLIEAAEMAKLTEPFVQTCELGDYSVSYRVCGLLTDLSKLLATRSRLRNLVMDTLHKGGVEIVSPTFMNQRQILASNPVIPQMPVRPQPEAVSATPDAVVFDKADKAETVESVRKKYEAAKTEIREIESRNKESTDETLKTALVERIERLKARAARWKAVLKAHEEKLSKDD